MCSTEVSLSAFFDIEFGALNYSVEDDGSVKLSEQPYLKVSSLICWSHKPAIQSLRLSGSHLLKALEALKHLSSQTVIATEVL